MDLHLVVHPFEGAVGDTDSGPREHPVEMAAEHPGELLERDIPLPNNVRRYYIPSTTHGGGGGGFNQSPPATMVNCPGNNYGQGILRANPVPHTQTVNALRYHFRRWVMEEILPPPSKYPTLRGAKNDRNLVEPRSRR